MGCRVPRAEMRSDLTNLCLLPFLGFESQTSCMKQPLRWGKTIICDKLQRCFVGKACNNNCVFGGGGYHKG